ncbi:hypothetical protein J6590_036889 [Homalodisca vitripennis]|nr:hypothetical protein J6590_036889 [Homalodisca vitripennis]
MPIKIQTSCIGDGAGTTVWCLCGHVWTCRLKTALQFFQRMTADSHVGHAAVTQLNDADVHFGGFSLDNGPDVAIDSPEPLYLDYDSDIIRATP